MNTPLLSATVATLLLAGCSTMLPHGSSDTPSTFTSYADAQAAAERIQPFKTAEGDLRAIGFDIQDGKNVTVIPYPEIVARLAPYSGVPLDRLDRGIRTCILAQSDCRGYLFRFGREERQREGPFVGDFFNLHRTTNVNGWWFEALVVVSDGMVLFRNVGGEAHVQRVEEQKNPLGPLQPAGEAAGSILLR